MITSTAAGASESLRYASSRPIRIGYATAFVLFAVFILWGTGTTLSGAVIARGEVRLQHEPEHVQHQIGGRITQVFTQEGAEVAEGDVLLRLDATSKRSQLVVLEQQIAETFVRLARFEAERDGAPRPDFSTVPELSLIDESQIVELASGQERLFDARHSTFDKERDQIHEQQNQIRQEIVGLEAQLLVAQDLLALADAELTSVNRLFQQQLVSAKRVSTLTREKKRLEGEAGRVSSMIAKAKKQISELEFQKLGLKSKQSEHIIQNISDLRVSFLQLKEKRRSLLEEIDQLDIRAPTQGVVFNFGSYSPGSIIKAADTILSVVPSGQSIEVKVQVRPEDIENVFVGQSATIIIRSFNRREIPEMNGHVKLVSADAMRDAEAGIKFYEALVEIDDQGIETLKDARVVPGMPAQVFMETQRRTPLAYLADPFTHYIKRAFRE